MGRRDKKLVLEASERFKRIMEYTVANGSIMQEVDDENQDNKGQDGAPMGGNGAPMGGNGAPMDGEGAPMGGEGAPMGGEGAPMGGEGAPMGGEGAPMGGEGASMGGEGAPMGGEGGPAGFNPQSQGEGEPPMGGDDADMGDTEPMQSDDEVIDVSDLTDSQEATEKAIKGLDSRFDKVLKAIGKFEDLIKQNDDKIETLKKEFQKRNPTQLEKLGLRAATSYPFNISPAEYWKDKESSSNYRIEDDNNGIDQQQYTITANDISGASDWKSISDSLDDKFLYNQTLDGVLKF